MTGRRLLHVSRQTLERIGTLALVYQITEDKRFALRAIQEMKSAANFEDWNPSHFLDTAEMSLALAIGYDWLQDELTDKEKDALTSALLEKGIQPSMTEPEAWFIKGNNNWNQVCHAGLIAAAIAIADREPSLAEGILRRGIDNLHHAAGTYAPDGAYPEGPMYWNYGTSFHVILAAALERFTGNTQGVDAYPGFASSADYVMQMTTPSGNFYPYADCRSIRHMLIPLFWFARKFKRPDWLEPDLQLLNQHLDLYDKKVFADGNYRLLPLALLWHDPALLSDNKKTASVNWLGTGNMPVAVYRSAFNNPDALYAAIKGGSPSLSHAHMDVGSFMIESDGITWAMDPGMQEYESLEKLNIGLWNSSQNGQRWSIFRLGPEGHNILRFNQAPQRVEGKASFIRFSDEGKTPHGVLDLSSLYMDQVASVHRGLMMLDKHSVLIQDEWVAGPQTVKMTWQMLTPAEISIHGQDILLSKNGKRRILRVLDSPDIFIQAVDVEELLKSYDAPNPGMKRIAIHSRTEAGEKGRLRVLLTPESGFSTLSYKPLGTWSLPLS